MRYPTVASIMTTKLVSTTVGTAFQDAARMLAEHGVSALPVVDERGVLVGVVSEADLLRKEEFRRDESPPSRWPWMGSHKQRKAFASTVEKLMTAPAITIAADAPADEAAKSLSRNGVRRLFVVDDDGHPIGVIARRDLLKLFLRGDAHLAAEVEREVFQRVLWADLRTVQVAVEHGVVTLSGELDTKSEKEIAVRLTRQLPGVVDVVDRLDYRADDTYSTVR